MLIGHYSLVADSVASALRNAVGGDSHAIEQIEKVAHTPLAEVGGSLAPLVLTRVALRRVLSDLRDEALSTEPAHRWASFV